MPALDSAVDSIASQAVGECSCQCTQVLKAILFNLAEREAAKERIAAAAGPANKGSAAGSSSSSFSSSSAFSSGSSSSAAAAAAAEQKN